LAAQSTDVRQRELSFPSEADRRVITIVADAYDPPSGPGSDECRFTGFAVFQTAP